MPRVRSSSRASAPLSPPSAGHNEIAATIESSRATPAKYFHPAYDYQCMACGCCQHRASCRRGWRAAFLGLIFTLGAVFLFAWVASVLLARFSSPPVDFTPFHSWNLQVGEWGIRGLTAVALAVALWYWSVRWHGAYMSRSISIDRKHSFAYFAAVSLRSQLRFIFPPDLHAPAWINLSGVDLVSSFGLPKDVDILGNPLLLWTSQTERFWQELKVEPTGGNVRAQILAGPAGIGKSHIALLLALRCYAEGIPVLYVPDAGKHLETFTPPDGRPTRATIDAPLLRKFARMNADLVLAASAYRISYDSIADPSDKSFMRLLHECKAVVILDEHGHAYNKLVNAEPPLAPGIFFPLLLPNSYIDKRLIRCVFCGSNQARFEYELNDTYTSCLRFVVPFLRSDARPFLHKLLQDEPTDAVMAYYERWANFVPREMRFLKDAKDYVLYVNTRRRAMAETLTEMNHRLVKQDISGDAMKSMTDTLNQLFQKSSMAFGAESYSFLDIGFVFRRGNYWTATAVPLCHPAKLALLDLWRSKLPAAGPRLVQVCAEGDGSGFENLAWEVLLARGFVDGSTIECKRLGSNAHVEPLQLGLSDYFVSSLECSQQRQEEINREISDSIMLCKKLKLTLLYRCPKRCPDVDFFILRSTGKCAAIQLSLSALSTHVTARVSGVSELFGKLDIERFVYITFKPALHPILAKNASLSHVRIVDAALWIGL